MYTLEHQKLYKEIRTLFDSAKNIIKKIEGQSKDKTPILNARFQIMFAGLHLSRAIDEIENIKVHDEEIKEIRSHCRRAENYAHKHGIEECLVQIDALLQSTKSSTTLPALLTDYANRKRQIRLAREFVQQDNVDLCKTDEYKTHYENVSDSLGLLIAIHDDLKEDRKRQKKKYLVASVTALGTIMGGVGIFYKPELDSNVKAQPIEQSSKPTIPAKSSSSVNSEKPP